jgi:hypothetical protein
VDDSKYAKYLGAWELMKQALEMPTEAEKDTVPVSDAPVMEPARDPARSVSEAVKVSLATSNLFQL